MTNPNRRIVRKNLSQDWDAIIHRAAVIWKRDTGKNWDVCPGTDRVDYEDRAIEELRDEGALVLDGLAGGDPYE